MFKLVPFCVLLALGAAACADVLPRALIVKASLSEVDISAKVAKSIEAAGYQVEIVDAAVLDTVLSQAMDDSSAPLDLVVVTDSAYLPASAAKSIDRYLNIGGNIIALRAPLWQASMVKLGGRWITSDEYRRETASLAPSHLLFDFKPGSSDIWQRTADNMDSRTDMETGVPGPGSGIYAMHVKIHNLTGWDNFGVKDLDQPFPEGHTLFVFAAKGGPKTSQIAVEIAEKDGSRWIATVPVDQHWRRYVLKPEEFKYWTSNPARGGRGDKLKPAQASIFAFGLAFSHTGPFGGEHEFWISQVGTASRDESADIQSDKPDAGPHDLLNPGYKFFECTGVGAVTSIYGDKLPASGKILSPHPRPEGRGFDRGRQWRFIPLATAKTAKGEWRGTPVAMMVHTPDSNYKGGVWACFGYQEPAAYENAEMLSLIQRTAQRIRQGLFLLEGGTNFFTYFEDQEMTVGARALNLGRSAASGIQVKQKLVEAGSGKSMWDAEKLIDIPSAQVGSVQWSANPMPKRGAYKWPKGGLIVTTTLLQNGRVIDEISHEVHQWTPKAKKQFITTKDGQFFLNGKPWKAHGVNYMPSSGIATEDGEYFEHWIGARAYDPEIVQRDLEHIKDLGLNSISAFIYTGHHEAGNLLDLLRRCENLNIKVNLSLRPGTPMDFLWDKIRLIIERDRLWENDTIFAYDLAWEPSLGGYDARKRYDGQWEDWIKERYGSIENAEADWGCPVPRADGKVTGPSNAQLVTDGEWRRMVAAYRRFCDDLLYVNYNRARMLVQSIDPNHLVSFRMSEAGNPTYNWDAFLPYDFPQLAAAVDILEPEAYGRISDQWDRVKAGRFEREWARLAAPEKPMLWAEVGVSAWDVAWMTNKPEKLDYQAKYFELFYKMLITSGANGVYWWFYPGGFRYGENSDYGIINPDGSDRASSQVIRKNAKAFLGALFVEPDVWIEVDRDADARGLFAIHEKTQEEFWKLVDAGKKPGLKTAGTGTTSQSCPLVAVGNTRYHGNAPAKYLNAAFDRLEIKDASGKWIEVKDGSEVTVDKSKPVIARALVRNLGDAKWLSGAKAGCVEMVCHMSLWKTGIPIPQDVPKHQTVTIENAEIVGKGLGGATTVHIFMRTRDRAEFGEVVKVRLVPK